MGIPFEKYHTRAYRYILNTEDESIVRLTEKEAYSWAEKTELCDISMTGLSFVTSPEASPKMNDIITIQFKVPGSEQMACYAIVTRIDAIDPHEQLVALFFFKLNKLQQLNLARGLAENKKKRNVHLPNEQKIKSFFLLTLSLVSWIYLMKLLYLK